MAGGGRILRRPTDRAIACEFACTLEEVAFVRIFVAMGEDPATAGECYLRAFCRPRKDGKLVQAGPEIPLEAMDDDESYPPMDDKDAKKLALKLLEKPHVKGYLEELNLPTDEAAKVEQRRQLMTGDEKQRADAAKAIRAEAEKHRFDTDVDRYMDILRKTGVELVIPLPERVSGHVACTECNHIFLATLHLDLTCQFDELFPDHATVHAESDPGSAAS